MKLTKKEVPDFNDSFLSIDLEGLDIGVPVTEILFNIKTYDKLKRAPISKFELWMRPINLYFESIPDSEKKELALMYLKIKSYIHEVSNSINIDVFEVIERIATECNFLFKKLNVVEKLTKIVKEDSISIPNLENQGKRPQDKPSLTFVYEEYIELTVVTLICKIFCPIFGEIIHVFFKKEDNIADRFLKERYTMGIIKYITQENFSKVMEKLNFYILNEINKTKNFEFGAVFHGYTKSNLVNFVSGSMFVKKFVNINLYKKDGNLIVFVLACIKYTLSSIITGIKTKSPIKERFIPSDNSNTFDSEDGNKSNLEVELKEIDTTVDIPIIVRTGVMKLINQKVKKYKINTDVLEEGSLWYFKNPLPPTPINLFLCSIYFSKEVGGANAINMLTADIYYKAITFLQMYFHHNGFESLIEPMSMIPTEDVKEDLSIEEHSLRIERGAGLHFQRCQEKFTLLDSSHTWNSFINDTICDSITLKNNIINIAPSISAYMGKPNKNGELYKSSANVLDDIYKFISKILS